MVTLHRWAVVAVSLAMVLGVDAFRRAQQPGLPAVSAQLEPATKDAQTCVWSPESRSVLPMPEGVGAAHASSLLVLPPSHPDHARTAMMAFWFAGTRESAADVSIVASRLDRSTREWSPAFTVVDREQAGRSLGVRLRRLGNPVGWADVQGRLHLFVVGTGLGGWAASRRSWRPRAATWWPRRADSAASSRPTCPPAPVTMIDLSLSRMRSLHGEKC